MRLFVQGAVLLLGMGFLSAPAKAQKVVIEDDAPNSIVLVSQDKAGDEIVRRMRRRALVSTTRKPPASY